MHPRFTFASLLALASVTTACGGTSPAPDAGPPPALDASPADATTADPMTIGRWMREQPAVVSSARAEARDGATPSCQLADGSCLDAPCEHAAGCFYLADMTYLSTSVTGTDGPPLTIHALYFQAAAQGARPEGAPIALLNHGGTSLGTGTVAFAVSMLGEGYAVLASSYRGANGAQGEVEGCLGEADDVRILAELVRSGVPDAPLAMVGGSHGGCVTLQALQAGAPVDAAVALWPGTDGARRYRYNLALAAPDSELVAARDRCAGMTTACCATVRGEYAFVTDELVGGAMSTIGALPDWETTPYACDDPTFRVGADVWTDLGELETALCSRSPLARASTLDGAYAGPLLIVHGERDPYIHFEESCEYARQAGGFVRRRIDDSGVWVAAGAIGPCAELPLDGGEPDAAWTGLRHLVLIQPLGHGDTGRASATDACDATDVASPSPSELLFGFLEAKLGLAP